MVKIRPDEISSIIRQQIEQYNSEVKVVNVGTVFQVVDVVEGRCKRTVVVRGAADHRFTRYIKLVERDSHRCGPVVGSVPGLYVVIPGIWPSLKVINCSVGRNGGNHGDLATGIDLKVAVCGGGTDCDTC